MMKLRHREIKQLVLGHTDETGSWAQVERLTGYAEVEGIQDEQGGS